MIEMIRFRDVQLRYRCIASVGFAIRQILWLIWWCKFHREFFARDRHVRLEWQMTFFHVLS